jgi:hypothetical protein
MMSSGEEVEGSVAVCSKAGRVKEQLWEGRKVDGGGAQLSPRR